MSFSMCSNIQLISLIFGNNCHNCLQYNTIQYKLYFSLLNMLRKSLDLKRWYRNNITNSIVECWAVWCANGIGRNGVRILECSPDKLSNTKALIYLIYLLCFPTLVCFLLCLCSFSPSCGQITRGGEEGCLGDCVALRLENCAEDERKDWTEIVWVHFCTSTKKYLKEFIRHPGRARGANESLHPD